SVNQEESEHETVNAQDPNHEKESEPARYPGVPFTDALGRTRHPLPEHPGVEFNRLRLWTVGEPERRKYDRDGDPEPPYQRRHARAIQWHHRELPPVRFVHLRRHI